MNETDIKLTIKVLLVYIVVYIISSAYTWIGSIAFLIQDGVTIIPEISSKGGRDLFSILFFCAMNFIFTLDHTLVMRNNEDYVLPWSAILVIICGTYFPFIFGYDCWHLPKRLYEDNAVDFYNIMCTFYIFLVLGQ